MSKLYYKSTDDAYAPEGDPALKPNPQDAEVNEQHPLPTQITWKSEWDNDWGAIDEAHGLPVQVVDPNPRVSVGSQYGLSFASTAVTKLTVPDTAKTAEIYIRTASIVFTRSGVKPTATAGFQADPSDIIILGSRDSLIKFAGIAVSATATGDVEFFADVSN